jgi:hypothetical protein
LVRKYIKSLWNSIPPEDVAADDTRLEMGNGARGDDFYHAHWFTLPHVIIDIPPVQLLSSEVEDSIREFSSNLVIEVTSGDQHLTQSQRIFPDALPLPVSPLTCGAFRLSVDISRRNPLEDELDQLREDAEALGRKMNRINDLLRPEGIVQEKLRDALGKVESTQIDLQSHQVTVNDVLAEINDVQSKVNAIKVILDEL